MKTFLLLVLSVTAVFLWQRNADRDAVGGNNPTVARVTAAPASPHPVYKHDWAKNSLDRAHEVMDDVAQTREQNANEDR